MNHSLGDVHAGYVTASALFDQLLESQQVISDWLCDAMETR